MRYTLAALGGGKLDLASLRGKVVIFDFWATWCVPCRAQHPLYEEVKQRFRGRPDVVFLSVDTDEDHGVVPSFLQAQNWSNQVYFDSGLVKLLAIDSIPSTMISDKKGRLVSRMDGYLADKFVDQLTARIKSALEAPAE
jgi:thiol-disulfide isomerase/thioredoxin